MDVRYSELMDRGAPALSSLQNLTTKSSIAMRQTNPVFFSGDLATVRTAAAQADKAVQDDRVWREETAARLRSYCTDEKSKEFEAAGDDFTSTARRVIKLYYSDRLADAIALREGQLYPALQRYQLLATSLAEHVCDELDRRGDSLSGSALSCSNILIFLGLWPISILAGMFVVTAVFILVFIARARG